MNASLQVELEHFLNVIGEDMEDDRQSILEKFWEMYLAGLFPNEDDLEWMVNLEEDDYTIWRFEDPRTKYCYRVRCDDEYIKFYRVPRE